MALAVSWRAAPFRPAAEGRQGNIATARQMGVEVKMVTGDALAIAQRPPRHSGWAATSSMPRVSATSSARRQRRRPSPSKRPMASPRYSRTQVHIVDVLQKRGHIVGMTGDGVNDAPALKKATAASPSRVRPTARGRASIVLTTPGLAVIIDAIKESRKIFQR